MIITQIRRLDSKKSLIDLDDEPFLAVYTSELNRYGLLQGQIIDEALVVRLRELVFKRCRERAAFILERRDQTRAGLREKLVRNHYPLPMIEEVLDELECRGYIDDRRFARNYIRIYGSSKSTNRLYALLLSKGLCQELVKEVIQEECFLEETFKEQQYRLIEKELKKKKYSGKNMEKQAFKKMIASLMYKGFRYEEIMQVCEKMEMDREPT